MVGALLLGCSASSGSGLSKHGTTTNGQGASTSSSGASGSGGTSSLFGSGGDFSLGGQSSTLADGGCVAHASKAELIPVDLYIMFDQSLSMSCAIPTGGDRWTAAKNATQQFVQSQGAAGLGVGIQYFGQGGVFSSCNPPDYETPDVEIAPLPGNATPIIDSLNNHAPSTNTPTAAGLSGAINHAIAWQAGHRDHVVVVVLVTDGQPNACGTVADVATVAAAGLTGGHIRTYVIGVISPGSSCGILDPNPPNQPDLDKVAAAGGTDKALMVDTSQNAGQQFLDKLNQIRGQVQIPCEFQIPPAPNGQTLNYHEVNVDLKAPDGSKVTVYHVDSAATCDPAQGGWYYDRPTSPTKVQLCPKTCGTVDAATFKGQVDVALGCATIDIPK